MPRALTGAVWPRCKPENSAGGSVVLGLYELLNNLQMFCRKSYSVLIMMNSVKCDTDPGQERGVTEEGVSPAQTEWGLGGGRKGSEGWRAAAQSPSQSVALAVTRDTWRNDWPGLSWARADVSPLGMSSYCNLIISSFTPQLGISHIVARRNSEELWKCCPNVSLSLKLWLVVTHLSCSH